MDDAMSMISETDVLICGAGAAGLTLAVDLARRHVPFRLIDQAAGPFQGSRGKGIQPRSQEVFEDLGVLDRIVAAGGAYPPLRTYRDGGADEAPFHDAGQPTPQEPYAAPLMSPQFLTEAALRERLAEFGRRPSFGHALTGFQQDEQGVTATIACPSGETTVRAGYLVGADGGRSFVRRALGIAFSGRTLDVRAIVADVTLEGLGDDVWHRWQDPHAGPIAICPLRGANLFQIQAPVPFDGDVDLSAKGLNALVAARTGRQDIEVRSVAWASDYGMNARLADRYRVGRVFLAGDAAHVHPPTGGQGLNTSLQDAYNLGWKLAAVLTGAPDGLLDSYEAERRAVAADVLGLSTGLLGAAARGETRRGRTTSQLDIGYPDSVLSLRTPALASGIQAGDRAPDAPCRGAAGQATRLFRLFAGPHWTLLAFDCVHNRPVAARAGLRIHTVGARGEIIDDGGQIRRIYGLSPGDLVLVRPDGYVGATVASGETAALEAYLARVGLGAAP
jgi:2-polyprenyl-6-methoxyphenol hydroxylase-like FAD-dependent oxidoreductase